MNFHCVEYFSVNQLETSLPIVESETQMRVGLLGAKQRFLVIKERFRLAENLRSAHCSPFVVSKVLAKLNALLACSQRPWFDPPVSELTVSLKGSVRSGC